MTKQIDYTTDIVSLFKDLYPLDTGTPIIPDWLAGLLYTFFPLPEGNPAARNVLWSTSKKQGKSTIGGLVALFMASRRKYAEVVISAADLDQSKDRIFRSVKYAVEHHPVWSNCKAYKDVIELDNGSLIQAIPFDWRGAAGGNYDAAIFDELHTYTQESHRRQFDELVIPPQKPHGVRWITSYAGFLGESTMLHEIWEKALKGKRINPQHVTHLPLYMVPDANLMAYIDTGEKSWRMPWSTPEYMKQIQASERPNTFRRLWLNEWVSNESEFITREQWDGCKNSEVRPLQPDDKRKMVLGADASTTRDNTSLVGVYANPQSKTKDVIFCRVWKPEKSFLRGGKPTVDLDLTIKAEILRLHKAKLVDAVYFDPYQLHSIALELIRAGVKMVELPQTNQRVESDQALYDAIIGHMIRHYGDPTLTEHITNAVAVETPRGYRLAKERTTRKIDAAVAMSMAHFGASARGSGGFDVFPRDDRPRGEYPMFTAPPRIVWQQAGRK
jgi:phage terminase large subunit-like protein